jgi:sarcosine oxidase
LSERFDAIVVGMGVMGSAVAYHLSARGARVLALDMYDPPHARGSSHGESRIIREAYFEDPRYVPLVRRSFELWERLEEEVGGILLRRTGALLLGGETSPVITGSLRSAEEHGIPVDDLDSDGVARRFPMFRPDEEMRGVFEWRAGVLDPEGSVAAMLVMAEQRGAVLRTGEPVLEWRESPHGVEVLTGRGRYASDALVLAAGPWMPDFLPEAPLSVERQVMLWFEPLYAADSMRPPHCPVFLVDCGAETFYGIPDLGGGVKAALHHGGVPVPPGSGPDEVQDDDVSQVRGLLRRYVPPANGTLKNGVVCRYTNTPGGHFIIDRLPQSSRTWALSPCSGHGFKFATAIGEAVAGWILDGSPTEDLTLFRFPTVQTPRA